MFLGFRCFSLNFPAERPYRSGSLCVRTLVSCSLLLRVFSVHSVYSVVMFSKQDHGMHGEERNRMDLGLELSENYSQFLDAKARN